jgi:hypothetical protein
VWRHLANAYNEVEVGTRAEAARRALEEARITARHVLWEERKGLQTAAREL